ncbi:hypothetical protein EUA06_05445 [Nocardioides glacieisoli]|uniref:DUF1579 domain-containing protein n=1 Tax=Nocardioides glacieisoli TaxID=1168730 RepID=A0A4Q2RTI9_9ACTN|nr:hypothetical protein [Nocardioides glacieisoli]RYB92401.1 hypothetical protein EUA06_05445 [Nocardioides glacieisoli]
MIKRHRSPRHRTVAVAVLGVLTLTAGCGSSDGGSPEDANTPTSSSTEAPPEPETETEAAEATPIDGTWTTPTLAAADFRRVLAAHGLGTHADTFLSEYGDAVDLTLELGGGFWTLSSSIDGGATALADRGSFELDGTKVVVRPSSGGRNTFRWKVAGDELTLDLVSTTEPPYEGVPAETFLRGLYTASSFRSMS